MISQLRRIALFSLLVISPHTFAAGDVARGEALAETCLGCHGIASYTTVYPTYKVPKLGGQHADYMAAALKSYRSGERSHKTMRAQAARLSDADIADIASYLASLK
jgi:cytochrome c553